MITGYTATLTGGTSGVIAGVGGIKIGGQSLGVLSAPALDDASSVATKIPGHVTGKPLTCTVVYAKALYATLRTAALGKVKQSWTVARTSSGSWAAANAFITHVGRKRATTRDVVVFDMEITPATVWVRTAQTH